MTEDKRDYYAPIKQEYRISHPKDNDDADKTDKRVRGMNKKRKKGSDSLRICNFAANQKKCEREFCKFEHDIDLYMSQRGKDLSEYMRCPHYESCKFGLSCRFAESHVKKDADKDADDKDADEIFKDENITNSLSLDTIKLIRSKSTLTASAQFEKWHLEKIAADKEFYKSVQRATKEAEIIAAENATENDNANQENQSHNNKVYIRKELPILDIPERKKLDFKNKTFLAPLTTVGNLPFRRLCKGYGVDVTCAEMALTGHLVAGNRNEWALLRRHKCEDFFGVQIAGSKAMDIAHAAESISQFTDADFIDLNLGCPVDIVTKAGGGSALLERKNRLGEILNAFKTVSKIPFTIKCRTGIQLNKNVTHGLLPIFNASGASLITLHGRCKEQRYTKLANWEYISECAAQNSGETQFFGNGDVLSWEDYYRDLETGVDGVMIGRGALIKPWIFQEIKERRTIDISSSERLDLLKKFANYGLEYWGSDNVGIDHTRRYMLEWLSFSCRYIPVGLLEVLPQKMNDRPPPFMGRNDLETLMASNNAADWIKLTEMVLGPVSETFSFVPKHKSNSYS